MSEDYSSIHIQMKGMLREIYNKANAKEVDQAKQLANELAMKSLELIAALKSHK